MKAYVAYPHEKNKSYPGLILFQEAGGVNNNIKGIAERLSKEGYIVIAPELYHRSSEPAFQIDHVDMEKIMFKSYLFKSLITCKISAGL